MYSGVARSSYMQHSCDEVTKMGFVIIPHGIVQTKSCARVKYSPAYILLLNLIAVQFIVE